MSPVERLHELGGVATYGTLLRVCERADLERALAGGDVARVARGLYALPQMDEHRLVAARRGGTLCLTSAALRHGWAVKTVPDRPHLMFSRGRRLDRSDRSAHTHRGDLTVAEVDDGVTDQETTLAHCLRRLPFDEALAVADSALRAGVGRSTLERIADTACGPGSPQMRRVVAGWIVLRFSWEQVMTQPGYVREVLVAAVALAERMHEVGPCRPGAA